MKKQTRFIFLSLALVSILGAAADGKKRNRATPPLSLGQPVPVSPAPLTGNEAPEMGPVEMLTPLLDAAGQKYGYPMLAAVWRFADGAPKTVFVCWETGGFTSEKAAVRSAVEGTWQANSGLRFSGWEQCGANTAGIRIQIEDSGPHTKGLGKQLDKVRNGMVLNFTYENWSKSCQQMRDFCNRSIAVHEFGHAIGLSHEQNRPDTPGECATRRQGSNGDLLLTEYDPDSAMNYCNERYNNDGKLSRKDVITVQALYCSPADPRCKPLF